MKLLTVIALLSLSLSSFAGRIIRAGGSCSDTVDPSISTQRLQADLTACAERDAYRNLSAQCSGADFYLSNDNIGQRNVKSSVGPRGRTMVVTALAVGTCERFTQF